MKVSKSVCEGGLSVNAAGELCEINRFAKAELSAEQVYTFSVVLCDNEVDRDFERFSETALKQLAELFVGKTGIFDHEWKASNQTARIYRTELVRQPEVFNSLGEPYCALKGFAYMLRSEKNEELIAEIDAGIKKETSVGCCMNRRVCSVCGDEPGSGGCGHVPGREYDGKLCYTELCDASDAYEWSFVAVPAQKAAGVIKRFDKAGGLKSFVEGGEGRCFLKEFEELSRDAALGRAYRDELRREVLRLGLLCDRALFSALKDSSKHMGEKELCGLKAVLEGQLAARLPLKTQLPGRDEVVTFVGEEYRV